MASERLKQNSIFFFAVGLFEQYEIFEIFK